MALYTIEFKHTEIYYHDETIEASSMEEAARIAEKLLDTEGFQEDLMDRASYDDHEDEFIGVRESSPRECHATMDAGEIAGYIGEE